MSITNQTLSFFFQPEFIYFLDSELLQFFSPLTVKGSLKPVFSHYSLQLTFFSEVSQRFSCLNVIALCYWLLELYHFYYQLTLVCLRISSFRTLFLNLIPGINHSMALCVWNKLVNLLMKHCLHMKTGKIHNTF